MFYVSNSKVYLTERNSALGVYQEVRITDGKPAVLNTGSVKKPPNSTICTLEELVAQFGGNYPSVKPRVEKTKAK